MKTKLLAIPLLALVIIFSACNSGTPQYEASGIDQQIYQDAVSTNNLELCKTIESQDFQEECQIVIKGNEIVELALKEGKAEKCNEIESSLLKESCLIQVKAKAENAEKEKKIQQQLEEETQEATNIKSKALEAKNADLCDEIPDENRKYSCRYEILVNQAIQSKNPSLCEKIGNKEQTEICKQNAQISD